MKRYKSEPSIFISIFPIEIRTLILTHVILDRLETELKARQCIVWISDFKKHIYFKRACIYLSRKLHYLHMLEISHISPVQHIKGCIALEKTIKGDYKFKKLARKYRWITMELVSLLSHKWTGQKSFGVEYTGRNHPYKLNGNNTNLTFRVLDGMLCVNDIPVSRSSFVIYFNRHPKQLNVRE